MMWLANQQAPDFRTINRFRVHQMGTCLQDIFEDFIAQLLSQGYVSGNDYYLDGTKIEADANRYTFVWKKATQRYQAVLQEKVRAVFNEINDQIKLDHQEIQEFMITATRMYQPCHLYYHQSPTILPHDAMLFTT